VELNFKTKINEMDDGYEFRIPERDCSPEKVQQVLRRLIENRIQSQSIRRLRSYVQSSASDPSCSKSIKELRNAWGVEGIIRFSHDKKLKMEFRQQ
jgi:hypothetical protein